MEISAQLRREITRMGGARLFWFDKNWEDRPTITEKSISGSEILISAEDLDFSKLEWKENKLDGSMYFFFKSNPDVKYLPLFRVKGDNGYIVPVSGKGLWSTLKGFSYVSKDLSKIKGISFYSHTYFPTLQPNSR